MALKKHFLAKHIVKTGFIAALALTTALPAHAGFDWTPPVRQKQESAPVAAAPAPVVDMEPISAPPPEIDSFPAGGQIPAAAPIAAAPQTQDIAPPPVSQGQVLDAYETIDGFGSDIPLVLMLNQVVPSGYSYAFDPAVNPGSTVSWNGGRPWNEILDESLSAKGMHAAIAGQNVRIGMGPKPEKQAEPAPLETPAAAPSGVPEPLPAEGEIEPPSALLPASSAPAYEPPAHDDDLMQQSYPRRVRPDQTINAPAPLPPPADLPPPIAPEPFADPQESVNAPTSLVPSAGLVGNSPMSASPLPSSSAIETEAASFQMPVSAPQNEAAPVMDPFEINFWHAEQGESLKKVLEDWSSMAGVAMLWNAQADYTLPAPVRMHGTFPDAVTSVLTTFSGSSPRPLGKLHPNLPDGPSVLVIQNN